MKPKNHHGENDGDGKINGAGYGDEGGGRTESRPNPPLDAISFS